MQLRGTNALVTGGSRGVGPLIARELAAAGANVALAARSSTELANVAREIGDLGVHAVAIPTDLAEEASRRALVDLATAELGPIDVLVNNAGILEVIPFAAQTYEDMVRTIEVDLMGPLALTRLLLPGMLERKRGHVVTVASISGKKGAPYEATYCAAKAGLIAWNTAVRLELEGSGVGMSVICPSFITDSGVCAELQIAAPWSCGPVHARDVANAVVRAIRSDAQELIVATIPARPLLALDALSPSVGNLILKALGVMAFQQRILRATVGRLPAARERRGLGTPRPPDWRDADSAE